MSLLFICLIMAGSFLFIHYLCTATSLGRDRIPVTVPGVAARRFVTDSRTVSEFLMHTCLDSTVKDLTVKVLTVVAVKNF